MAFSEQLKEARINSGMTQQQVSDALGIDKSTYSGYETGKREPDVAKIKALAKLFGVSGDSLLETGFSKSSEGKKKASTTQEIAEAIDTLLYSIYGRQATVQEINNFTNLIHSLGEMLKGLE